ncbi:hypothetical protein C8256_03660 [Kluyvera genomosp. 2]|uniref:Uncharacterized protein n=1 Tax=Kluyvera genomosp. 2 TaxID=2774054 RepID=A0A2T2Y732_9ENTR|nr:hypothetical protein C8256_03660 [Kluyvera genomosp. 2]
MTTVTKYCYHHSLLLANTENLFYHSKNQNGLLPIDANRLRLESARRRHPPTSYILHFEVKNETDSSR